MSHASWTPGEQALLKRLRQRRDTLERARCPDCIRPLTKGAVQAGTCSYKDCGVELEQAIARRLGVRGVAA